MILQVYIIETMPFINKLKGLISTRTKYNSSNASSVQQMLQIYINRRKEISI